VPPDLGPPVWVDDPSFDLGYQVRRTALPAPGDDRDLAALDLPDALTGMRFGVRYRRHPEVEVTITHSSLTTGGSAEQAAVLPVRVRDDDYRLDPRGCLEVPLRRRHSDRR
jgi:hypothetical protein